MFLIGRTNNSVLDGLIRQEAKFYQDVVFGNFPDTYKNLYRKMVLSVEWPEKFCPGARYILKTDEDCYVNVPGMITWLETDVERGFRADDKLYAGAVNLNKEPDRDPSSQYFVSKKEYPGISYPPYVAGGGYIFSGTLLPMLAQSIEKVRLFPVEDASFGLLMRSIGVSPRNNARFLPFLFGDVSLGCYDEFSGCDYLPPVEAPICDLLKPLVMHDVKREEQIFIHFKVMAVSHVSAICDLGKT